MQDQFRDGGIVVENALGFWIHRVYQASRNEMFREFREQGEDITPEQWAVLIRLWERDERTQNELSEATFRDAPTISRILAKAHAFADEYAGQRVDARLLITVGELEQASVPGTPTERAKVLERRRMAAGAEGLAARLEASRVEGLVVQFHQFAEEAHGSVLLPAASRGVRFALEDE